MSESKPHPNHELNSEQQADALSHALVPREGDGHSQDGGPPIGVGSPFWDGFFDSRIWLSSSGFSIGFIIGWFL